MSDNDSASMPVEASSSADADGEPKEPVKKRVETLPLTQEALDALADRTARPRPLALSGRPQTTPAPPTFLRAKFQVGGASGPTNFARRQAVFHKDDLEPAKAAAAEALEAWKKERSNDCGVAERWNASVLPKDVLSMKRTRENWVHDRGGMYQFNFRAEVLPPQNPVFVPPASKFAVQRVDPATARAAATARAGSRLARGQFNRTAEMPVNPRLEGAPLWRPESRASRQEQRANTRRAHEEAQRGSERGKAALDPNHYRSPADRHRDFTRQLRALKSAGLTAGYAATREQAERIPRHNRLSKEPSLKARSFAHSGTFGLNPAEGLWMWSDTGSFDRDGPGDVATVRDPLAHNLASPNCA